MLLLYRFTSVCCRAVEEAANKAQLFGTQPAVVVEEDVVFRNYAPSGLIHRDCTELAGDKMQLQFIVCLRGATTLRYETHGLHGSYTELYATATIIIMLIIIVITITTTITITTIVATSVIAVLH